MTDPETGEDAVNMFEVDFGEAVIAPASGRLGKTGSFYAFLRPKRAEFPI